MAAKADEADQDLDSNVMIQEASANFTFRATKITNPSRVTADFSKEYDHDNALYTISIQAKAKSDDVTITEITVPGGAVTVGDTAQFITENEGDYEFEVHYTTADGTDSEVFTYHLTSVKINQDSDFTFNEATQTITGYNPNATKDVKIPQQLRGVDVLGIGDSAFAGQQLTSVSLPDTLQVIGEKAFENNRGLTSVVLPDSLISIGSGAFQNCSGLAGISIPDQVKVIEAYTFHGCENLASVNLNRVVEIRENAFSMSGLKTVTIPGSVTKIGDAAFRYSVLTGIVLEEGIEIIGDYAFDSTGVIDLVIPASVRSLGMHAFADCGILENITLSEGLERIGEAAFASTNLNTVIIPDSVTSIGGEAFRDCRNLTEIYITGKTSGSIEGDPWGSQAVVYWSDVVSIDSWLMIPTAAGAGIITGYLGNEESVTLPGTLTTDDGTAYTINGFRSSVFGGNKLIREVIIEPGYEAIPEGAFRDCEKLVNISIPDTVTSIGANAFRYCWSLIGISIPDTVTKIGFSAFLGCDRLESIVIPAGVTVIERETFKGCDNLQYVTLPDNLYQIEDFAFTDCDSLSTITIPGSVVSISSYAFTNTGSLKEIRIPTMVTEQIHGAPWGADGSVEVIWGDSVTAGSWAFSTSTNMLTRYQGMETHVTVPDTLEVADSITGAVTSYQVKGFGPNLFAGNTDITKVTILPKVGYLSEGMFQGCSSLTGVSIPDGTNIGRYAFKDCSSLTSVSIPGGASEIGWEAFENCINLTSVDIADTVTEIGNGAFSGCIKLSSVSLPPMLSMIGDSVFLNCRSLTDITIPDGVTSIGWRAFEGTGLNWLVIPGNIKRMDGDAFANTPNLKNIYLMTSRASCPVEVTRSQPWGAFDAKVWYMAESAGFDEHSVELVPGEFARMIQISASAGSGAINEIVLPDNSALNVGMSRWPSSGYYSYKVEAGGEYLFRGIDSSGGVFTKTVTVEGIGLPTVSADDTVIYTNKASGLEEADILTLVNARASTLELGDDFTGGSLDISREDVAKVQRLTTDGLSAVITVTATSKTGLTDSAAVTVTAADEITEVSFNANGGYPAPPDRYVALGQTIAKPADPQKANHTFDKWYRDAALTIPWNFETDRASADSLTLHAGYKINTYTVTFVDWDGSRIGSPQTVEHGQSAAAPAAPTRPGHTFTGWDKSFDSVTEDLVIKAQYSQDSSGGGNSDGGGSGGGNSGGGNSGGSNPGGGNSGGGTQNGPGVTPNPEVPPVNPEVPPVNPAEPPVNPAVPPVAPPSPAGNAGTAPGGNVNSQGTLSPSPLVSDSVEESSAPETRANAQVVITQESGTALKMTGESNGVNLEEETPLKPEFGREDSQGIQMYQMNWWIILLILSAVITYFVYKRRKRKQKMELE